jgi:hypothetical protein
LATTHPCWRGLRSNSHPQASRRATHPSSARSLSSALPRSRGRVQERVGTRRAVCHSISACACAARAAASARCCFASSRFSRCFSSMPTLTADLGLNAVLRAFCRRARKPLALVEPLPPEGRTLGPCVGCRWSAAGALQSGSCGSGNCRGAGVSKGKARDDLLSARSRARAALNGPYGSTDAMHGPRTARHSDRDSGQRRDRSADRGLPNLAFRGRSGRALCAQRVGGERSAPLSVLRARVWDVCAVTGSACAAALST